MSTPESARPPAGGDSGADIGAKRQTGRKPEDQAARLEQIIQAAWQLASEGGYEAVQMREVARRASVTLRTLYRLCPSKGHLIQAMLRSQLDRLRLDILSRPPRDPTPATRAAAVLVRAFHGLRQNRGYAHAVASTYHVPQPLSGVQGSDVTPDLRSFMEIAALGAWGPAHEPSEEEELGLFVLVSVFTSSMISWLNGTASSEQVEQRLRFAAERLLSSQLVADLLPSHSAAVPKGRRTAHGAP